MDELVAATNSLALVRHKAFDLSWLWARSPGRGTKPPTTLERCMDFLLWRKLELSRPALHLPSTVIADLDLWFDGVPEDVTVRAVLYGKQDGRVVWRGAQAQVRVGDETVVRFGEFEGEPLYAERLSITMLDTRGDRPRPLVEYPGVLSKAYFTHPSHPGRDVLAVHVAMSTFQPVRTWGKRWDAKTRRPRDEPGRPHLRVV